MASHFTYGAAIPDPHRGSQALRIGPLLCLGRVMSSEVRSVDYAQFPGNANLYYAPIFGTRFPISLLVLPLLYLATLISPSCHHLNVTVTPQPNVEPLFTFSMISSLPLMKLHSLHAGRQTDRHTHARTHAPHFLWAGPQRGMCYLNNPAGGSAAPLEMPPWYWTMAAMLLNLRSLI